MKWEAQLIVHQKEARIGVSFEKDPQLIDRIKKFVNLHW